MQGVQPDRGADGPGRLQLHHPGPALPLDLLQVPPCSPALGTTAVYSFGLHLYSLTNSMPAQLSPSMAPQDSNRAKLGPEQGTKQPIPPTFIKN